MSDIPPLAEEARASEARARLTGSIGALQTRLAPRTLAQNAVQGITEKGRAVAQTGIDTARKHPAAVTGAIAAIGLLFARKPLFRLFSRKSAAVPAPTRSTPHNRAARRNDK